MKTTAQGGWCLAVAALLFAATAARPQQNNVPDAGWNTRMTALQQEHDAQADVAVSIVFDDSGSMNDNNKLPMAKQAFRTWIQHAPDSYRFGLVALNAGALVPLRPDDRAEVVAAVNGLIAAGGTPLADTIAQVAAEIRRRRAAGAVYERQVVVILTDGEDTSSRGIQGVQEEIRALRANRVEVIAFGYQGEGDYMRACATHFYSPENEQDISKGLNAIGSEIGDTSDVVVDDATRAGMLKVADSVPPQPAATPPPTAAAGNEPFSPYAATPEPAAASTPEGRKKSHGDGHAWIWVVAIIFLLVVLQRGKRR